MPGERHLIVDPSTKHPTPSREEVGGRGEWPGVEIIIQRVNFRALLRGGKSDTEIRDAIAAVWGARDDRYSEIRSAETPKARKIEMSYIGG